MSQYMVSFADGLGPGAVGWNSWPGTAGWQMLSHENGHEWAHDGALNSIGRLYLLKHFRLEKIAEKFPLQAIATMSPKQLFMARRILETAQGLPAQNPVSDCPGDHISAALAA